AMFRCTGSLPECASNSQPIVRPRSRGSLPRLLHDAAGRMPRHQTSGRKSAKQEAARTNNSHNLEETSCARHFRSSALALAAGTALIALPARPADVTPDRLINADKEPQNWLMNHRTYDGQRFSPLTRINKDNVKNLRLAYAVALGGSAGDEWVE